jgi:hypothetical protein
MIVGELDNAGMASGRSDLPPQVGLARKRRLRLTGVTREDSIPILFGCFALRQVPGLRNHNEIGAHVLFEANRRIFLQSFAVGASVRAHSLPRNRLPLEVMDAPLDTMFQLRRNT